MILSSGMKLKIVDNKEEIEDFYLWYYILIFTEDFFVIIDTRIVVEWS